MHNPYDQFAKNLLNDALTRACHTETEVPVATAEQKIDMYCVPDPGRAAERHRMGLLGELAAEPSLFEPFRNTPSLDLVRECLRYLRLHHAPPGARDRPSDARSGTSRWRPVEVPSRRPRGSNSCRGLRPLSEGARRPAQEAVERQERRDQHPPPHQASAGLPQDIEPDLRGHRGAAPRHGGEARRGQPGRGVVEQDPEPLREVGAQAAALQPMPAHHPVQRAKITPRPDRAGVRPLRQGAPRGRVRRRPGEVGEPASRRRDQAAHVHRLPTAARS
jgi:hypothetical protein